MTALEPQPHETPAKESFAALLNESLGMAAGLEGTVVKGRVIALENDAVLIDVGLKAEGRVPLKEFASGGSEPDLHVGDTVEVYLERMEDKNGEAQLSREKARREEAWTQLEKNFQANERVTGVIFGRVKGGFTVDLNGAVAFLPGSQVDISPVRDITPLLGSPQPFQILKMDRSRGNIVVSRRAVLEESRAEQRSELVASLKEGQILNGVVKNITDYGAFVDLGGVDGLLHVTDIAWRRINHPSEALNIGQTVKVQVIRFNPETQRISLGMKQLEADPWEGVELKYPAGAKFRGRVTNITDYGAFVELEPGVEGLVHVSEMSWTKKNVHPGKIVSTSQEVEVMVLDVDPQKRRISLGLKQTLANPWETFAEDHPVGSEIEGEVRNITEFGLFIGLPGDIDGMVHLSDIDWNRPGEDAIDNYHKGETVRVKSARHRRRKRADQPRHQTARGGSVRSRHGQAEKGRGGHRNGRRHRRSGDRGQCRRRVAGLHPQVGTVARPERAKARPVCRRRKGRRQDHGARPRHPPGDLIDQGTRDGRGKARDGGVRIIRFGRQPWRHSWRRDQPRAPPGCRSTRRGRRKGLNRAFGRRDLSLDAR